MASAKAEMGFQSRTSRSTHGPNREDSYRNKIVVDQTSPDLVNVTVVEGDFQQLLSGRQAADDLPAQFRDSAGLMRSELPPPSETHSSRPGSPQPDRDSIRAPTGSAFWFALKLYARLFFSLFHDTFADEASERAYLQEDWYSTKTGALISGLYLFATWAAFVAASATNPPVSLYSEIVYYGVCSIGAVPVTFLVAGNVPHLYPRTWQLYLFVATWSLPLAVIFDAYQCSFFRETGNTCPNKDFVGFFTYLLAYPCVSLFLLKGTRWSVAVGGLASTLAIIITITPYSQRFVKSVVNFVLYIVGILWASYYKERADRRGFTLRADLKRQYRATQKAQNAERKADESKKGFTSYMYAHRRLIACGNLTREQIPRGPSAAEHCLAGLSKLGDRGRLC
jgi:hypothetical protein